MNRRELGPYPVICNVGYRDDKYVSGQIRSAAGGNGWIPASGASGVMFGAGDCLVQQQVQRMLPGIAGDKYHPAQVVARVEPARGGQDG